MNDQMQQLSDQAVRLLVDEHKSPTEVKKYLISYGVPVNEAELFVEQLVNALKASKRKKGEKDMLHGTLWCVGGIVATALNIGFIFWGAIVFGAIQFFNGLYTYLTNLVGKENKETEELIFFCKYCGYEQDTYNFEYCPQCNRDNDGLLRAENE